MKHLLAVLSLLLISTQSFAIEYGRFGPTVTSNGTQTIAAVGGAGGGGAQDRNCITNLTIDASAFVNNPVCTFQVASAGTTMWSVEVSSQTPSAVLTWSPPPVPGTAGYGLCGTRGATVTVTLTAGGCTAYDISSMGYVDR